MNLRRQLRAGFSIPELVVVAAMLALLAGILLPAIGHLKEQSRIVVCLSNLRTIGGAASAYLVEYHDLSWALPSPYCTRDGEYAFTRFSEHIWGGGRSDRTLQEWEDSGILGPDPAGSDCWAVPPKHRPMNRFIAPDVSWSNPLRDDETGRTTIPMELPACFKCPSDVTHHSRIGEFVERGFAHWEFWGTSYTLNWSWPYYYRETLIGRSDPYNGYYFAIMGVDFVGDETAPSLGRLMLKEYAGRASSRLVLFMEKRLDLVLVGAYPRGVPETTPRQAVGWHSRFNLHSAAFRDGSARYMYFDTRYVNGPGWSVWPEHPWEGVWAQYDEQNP